MIFEKIIESDFMANIIALAALAVSIISLLKSRKNAKDIDEIAKLKFKEVRLSTKPKLWLNGGSSRPAENKIYIDINNKGGRAYITDIDILDGDVKVFQTKSFELDPNERRYIFLEGTTGKSTNEVKYKLKVYYHDEGDFKYYIIIEGQGGDPKITFKEEL